MMTRRDLLREHQATLDAVSPTPTQWMVALLVVSVVLFVGTACFVVYTDMAPIPAELPKTSR